MNRPDPTDPLHETLQAWRVRPPADPNFRPAVWERIQRSNRQTWAAYVRRHIVAWSLSAGAAVVAAGVTGHSLARARLDQGREQMVVAYLGELDPRVMAKLRP